MTKHIVFIEPRFPANQKHFIRAFAEIGVRVSAIGEGSKDSLDDELRHWLTHYEEVKNVCDEVGVLAAVIRMGCCMNSMMSAMCTSPDCGRAVRRTGAPCRARRR